LYEVWPTDEEIKASRFQRSKIFRAAHRSSFESLNPTQVRGWWLDDSPSSPAAILEAEKSRGDLPRRGRQTGKCNQNCGMKLTAAYKKDGDWWAAWVEEIPGVNTQGATLEEARENLKDALGMVLEANRELSEKEQEATRREAMVVA
jgi:predicted RNase H-like HicB family nuclease